MKREDIICIARKAGFREPNPHDGCMGIAYDYREGADTGASLERFAYLVAQHEREKCAKVCELTSSDMNPMAHWAANECARLIKTRETQNLWGGVDFDINTKRPWVGLSETDFSAINQSCLTKLQAATSAESILKEKNS